MNLDKSFEEIKTRVQNWLDDQWWLIAILILFIIGKDFLDRRKAKNATSENFTEIEKNGLEQNGGLSPTPLDQSPKQKTKE